MNKTRRLLQKYDTFFVQISKSLVKFLRIIVFCKETFTKSSVKYNI